MYYSVIKNEGADNQFTVKNNLNIRKSYVNKLFLEIRKACLREGFTVSLIRKLGEEKNKPKPNQTKKSQKINQLKNPHFSEDCTYGWGNMWCLWKKTGLDDHEYLLYLSMFLNTTQNLLLKSSQGDGILYLKESIKLMSFRKQITFFR